MAELNPLTRTGAVRRTDREQRRDRQNPGADRKKKASPKQRQDKPHILDEFV